MKPIIKVAVPILTALSVFLLATHMSQVHAAASNSIWFQPGTSQRTTGQSFAVTVYANADPNFGTPDTNVTVKYPGNLVTVSGVTNGGALPSATITHNASAQTITLNHSFYGYSSGFTEAPLIKFTVRANKAGKATFNFTESFVRGHTVDKVASTYSIVSPTCPAGQVGTPPNCSTPPPVAPPTTPTPTPTPTPRPSTPSSGNSSTSAPRTSTPTPSSSTPNTSAPSSTTSPTTKKTSDKLPSLLIEDVDPQPRYTTSDVVWRTSTKASNMTFKYGTTSSALDNGSTVISSTDGTSHSVKLTELELGTTYYYGIAAKDSTGKTIIESGQFTTDAYPVTLRLTSNEKPLAQTDVSLKDFSDTYTTDDAGEVFVSLLPGDYTLQLTQNGATEEHKFTIKALEINGDAAPDTQVISVEFVSATRAVTSSELSPSVLPIILAVIGLLLLTGGFVGFILWRRHQAAASASMGYQSILSSDIYSSGPPPGYAPSPTSTDGYAQPGAYPQSAYAPATYTTPAQPNITAQGIPLAEEEPLDMWSAPAASYPAPSVQAPTAYPQPAAYAPQPNPLTSTPDASTTTPATPPAPSQFLPDNTAINREDSLTIHHQS